MLKQFAGALLTAILCSTTPVLAEPLHPVYLEKYGGTYSTDCDNKQADRLTVLAEKLVFTSGDNDVVAEDILSNVSYWGRMTPDGWEIALLAGLDPANSLTFLIYSDEQGIYVVLEEFPRPDAETRYYKCESGETQNAISTEQQE